MHVQHSQARVPARSAYLEAVQLRVKVRLAIREARRNAEHHGGVAFTFAEDSLLPQHPRLQDCTAMHRTHLTIW